MRIFAIISFITILFSTSVSANYFYCNLNNDTETVVFEISRKSIDAIKLIQRNKIIPGSNINALGGAITKNTKTTIVWETESNQIWTLDRVSGILIGTQGSNSVRWLCYKDKDL